MKTYKYKIFTSLLILAFIVTQVKAQEFYLRSSAGYSFESAQTEFNDADPNDITGIEPSTNVTVSADGSTSRIESLNGTLGDGFKFNITGGYMFNQFIGAELGINYFHGDETMIGALSSPVTVSEQVAYIRGFDLSPAIFVTPGFEGINPYAKLGLLMTAAGDLTIETSVLRPNGGGAGTDIRVDAEAEVTSKFSVGYVGAVGVLLPVNDRLSIFIECEFKSFTIKSDEAEITSYRTVSISGGQETPVPGEQLSDLSVSEKQFVFEEEFTISNTSPQPTNEPRSVPSQFVNAGGAGLNLGVRIGF